MDRESYDLASDDEIVDEFYTYFPQSHKLIVRNIKAKTLLIEESSDNRIHITIYGFIKRDLPSIHKSGMNGFVHVEGDLIPNGLYSQTLGTGVWSIHSLIPNLRVLPPKLQCDKIVINVPPKCRTILSWIEVHSFRTRVRLDDARIHCVRSMGMMKFSDLISPTVVLDGNTQMEIAHIGGNCNLTLYSDPQRVSSEEFLPYTQCEIFAGSIGVCTVDIPGEGYCHIAVPVSTLRGALGEGILKIKKPNENLLYWQQQSHYYPY